VQEEAFKNQKVGSTLKPLVKDTMFQGKIRFRNLTKEELGLLLWSVRLENESQMNIGKGKAYGYGRIQAKLKEVRSIDTKRAYDTESVLSFCPYITLDADELINGYKDSMTGFLKGKRMDELLHIKEFFSMKNKKPDPEKIRYMKLGNKKEHQESEYQSREKPLPTIRQILSD
jgi:CRISPR/Cas system CSM-associated protein Csm3 (group 7 of RAMP superfamily)